MIFYYYKWTEWVFKWQHRIIKGEAEDQASLFVV